MSLIDETITQETLHKTSDGRHHATEADAQNYNLGRLARKTEQLNTARIILSECLATHGVAEDDVDQCLLDMLEAISNADQDDAALLLYG